MEPPAWSQRFPHQKSKITHRYQFQLQLYHLWTRPLHLRLPKSHRKTSSCSLHSLTESKSRINLLTGIYRSPWNIVDGFTHHQALRHTRLDIEDGTCFQKQIYQYRVISIILSNPGGISHASFQSLKVLACIIWTWTEDNYFDSKLIFERNGETMERSNWLSCLLKCSVEFLGTRQCDLWEELKSAIRLQKWSALLNIGNQSVRFTSWWAKAALLQNAVVTATEVNLPAASWATRSVADDSVIASSSAVIIPLCFG